MDLPRSRVRGPAPATCHGRGELRQALERLAGQDLVSEIEEITACGDKVMVVIHTRGIDRTRVRQAVDRNHLVLTVSHELIVGVRACRNSEEARNFAGIT